MGKKSTRLPTESRQIGRGNLALIRGVNRGRLETAEVVPTALVVYPREIGVLGHPFRHFCPRPVTPIRWGMLEGSLEGEDLFVI